MFIEVGNQTMPGILSGCVGAGRQNSVKPTQYHTILKVGKIPHISEKKCGNANWMTTHSYWPSQFLDTFKLFFFSKHQRNLIPLLNSSKINNAFHGLALASPLVSVLHMVAFNPIFCWGIVTTVWKIKHWNVCFVIQPDGSYELTKLLFVYYYLNMLFARRGHLGF